METVAIDDEGLGDFFWLALRASAAVFSAVWLIISTLDYFGLPTPKHSGAMSYYLLCVHSGVAGLLWAAWRQFRRRRNARAVADTAHLESSERHERLPDELVATVARLHREGEYMEVVLLGRVLSRPLWISGRYQERIELGGFFEDAAAREGEESDRALALIDDLGWTHAAIGDLPTAKTNIERGIKVAEGADLWYLQAKGYRHLGAIAQKYERNPKTADNFLKRAEAIAAKIPDDQPRKEMTAGILFNRAEGALQMLDYEKARSFAERALEIYSSLGDQTREVKVMTLAARIEMTSGETGKAKDSFRAASAKARRYARRDELGKSLLGLGEAHLREGSFRLAANTLSEAVAVLRQIGLRSEAEKAADLLRHAQDEDSSLKAT